MSLFFKLEQNILRPWWPPPKLLWCSVPFVPTIVIWNCEWSPTKKNQDKNAMKLHWRKKISFDHVAPQIGQKCQTTIEYMCVWTYMCIWIHIRVPWLEIELSLPNSLWQEYIVTSEDFNNIKNTTQGSRSKSWNKQSSWRFKKNGTIFCRWVEMCLNFSPSPHIVVQIPTGSYFLVSTKDFPFISIKNYWSRLMKTF